MLQLAKVCAEYLAEKATLQKNIWVLDGDLADSDGADAFLEHHPEKFLACGIAEQNMISVAAGMATSEQRPWVFSFAAFLCYRAYDQIRTCVSQAHLPVTLVGSHAGGCGGRNGKTHVALNDIALISTLNNIKIWTPADKNDVELAVNSTLADNSPAYIRCPRDPCPSIPNDNSSSLPYRWIGNPSEVAIISYGLSTHWALKAQEILANDKINIGILHFCKIWPLEKNEINLLLKNVKTALVIEDHYAIGGLKTLIEHLEPSCKLKTLAWPTDWHGQSGDSSSLLEQHELSPSFIYSKIKNLLVKKDGHEGKNE